MSKKKKKNQGRAEAPPAQAEETENVSSEEQEAESQDSDEAAEGSSEQASGGDEHAHGHDAHDPVEEDRPRNGLIAFITLITCVVVVVFVVGVRELFNYWGGALVQERVLSVQNSQLRELRASEQQKLGHYQWVNKKDGVVRLPVDRAIELTVAGYRTPAQPPTLQEPPPKPEDGKVEEKKGEDGKTPGEPGKQDEKKDEKKGTDAPKEPNK